MMRLHLENIGPIDTVDIDVDSDLTFIYGRNNIGKSYTTTILYLILKNLAFDFPYGGRSPYGFFPGIRFEDRSIIKEIKDKLESTGDFEMTDNITRYFSGLITALFSSRFENSLHNSFGDISNLSNKISNRKFEMLLQFEEYNIHIIENNNKLTATYDGKGKIYMCRKIHRHWQPRQDGNKIIVYYNENDKDNDYLQFLRDIQSYFYKMYTNSIMAIISKIDNVYYLPASRSGLYRALNAFSQILVELAKKRSFLREKIVLPSISEQDSDYFSRINEINTKRRNQKYSAIAENIEKKLLKGEVSFDQTTKQILFHPNNIDINLELLGTSSMIAEVSPIVLYLRYIIGPEDDVRRKKDNKSVPIIFIEEPEAHLHPDAQVILTEYLVDLVKMGTKLVITSHSNYIFDRLNNLIAAKKINKEVINGILLLQGKKGSCSKIIPMSDLGMEDDNFIKTSEDLYNEKLDIMKEMETEDAE
jgi:predicted ATPase